MATKSIGYVVELIGDAQVRSVEGVIRVLSIGDQIHEGDVLSTGLNTQIVLEFFDGHKLQVGENTEILLDESVFAGLNAYPDARADQLAELQSLIVEGIDLAELEATAAGAANDSDALHQASVYSRDGDEGIVETRLTPFNLGSPGPDNQSTLSDGGVLISANSEDSVATQGSGAMPPPTTTITVDSITADDVINAVEAGAPINVTGTVGGNAVPGDTVSFTVNSTPYSGTVGAGNIFSISVAATDLVADTSFDATVSGTDGAGNTYTGSTTSTHTVDTSASATISVDLITTDDVVNAAESGSPINVTGSVGGDAAAGDTVSFIINGNAYSGTVGAGNTYSIPVAGADLAADTSFNATVNGSDSAGNPFSATTTSTHSVDTFATATINVNPITADDVINATESGAAINITGSVGGDAAPGDTITFTVNGNTYSGTVGAGNTFSISAAGADLAADTSFDATVTGNDAAGNPFSATTTSTHSVDISASATISVDPITPDDIVNAAEAGIPINVTGSVGGDAVPGDSINFSVNGNAYSGTVGAGNTFSIAVSGSDLVIDNTFDVTVTGIDPAGNPYSATTTSTHTVDTIATATITVDPITTDDILNAAEAGNPVNITGLVGGDASSGDTVSFIINGNAYSGTVGAGNTYSISVAGADLAADTSFDATVTGNDAAGNPFSATTTSTHNIDTSASATISVDPITADDVVNAAESGGSINVTGDVGGDAAPGDTVTFTVNGNAYSGTVGAGNTYSISVVGADLAADTSFDARPRPRPIVSIPLRQPQSRLIRLLLTISSILPNLAHQLMSPVRSVVMRPPAIVSVSASTATLIRVRSVSAIHLASRSPGLIWPPIPVLMPPSLVVMRLNHDLYP
jgi:hypothetical protein